MKNFILKYLNLTNFKNAYSEALAKTILWRIGISMPLGFLMAYLYFGLFWSSLQFTIISHSIYFIINYIFEIVWTKYFRKMFEI